MSPWSCTRKGNEGQITSNHPHYSQIWKVEDHDWRVVEVSTKPAPVWLVPWMPEDLERCAKERWSFEREMGVVRAIPLALGEAYNGWPETTNIFKELLQNSTLRKWEDERRMEHIWVYCHQAASLTNIQKHKPGAYQATLTKEDSRWVWVKGLVTVQAFHHLFSTSMGSSLAESILKYELWKKSENILSNPDPFFDLPVRLGTEGNIDGP